MSARLFHRFSRERLAGRKLFVPFITAGDRGLDFTRRAVLGLARAGADAVELGVPFSDPLADGPVIQRSSERALRRRTTLAGVLELVRGLRRETELPLLLMGYWNPFLQFGPERLARAAGRAGVDGFIVPDLPPEAAGDWIRACRGQDLDTVFLIAPTSTPARIRAVARASSGYVYYVSITGTTGSRAGLPRDLAQGLARVRQTTPLPILVGFGISTPGQAATVAGMADGVIVGSALVNLVDGPGKDGPVLSKFVDFARKLSKAVKNA